MARFFGRYEHSLDDKGRVILPSKFRGPFEHGGYLTAYQDGCLSLWTPEEFETQMQAMQERAKEGRSDRNLVRLWASTSHELEIDRQGRMAIPARLARVRGTRGRRPGPRRDRPGRAVEPSVLGGEGPTRGGTAQPGRRRVTPVAHLHVVRDGNRRSRSPNLARRNERREHPRPNHRARPSTHGSPGAVRAPERVRTGPPLTSRDWPPWPVTTCTSNESGPCAVPRPERWKNPPPPTSRLIVAALHPQRSRRSGDCG